MTTDNVESYCRAVAAVGAGRTGEDQALVSAAEAGVPQVGALVRVRGEQWAVTDTSPGEGATLVELQSVADGRYGEVLKVVWEVERGRAVLPAGSLPNLREGGFDRPERLAAFLDAVRWSAVTSAEVKLLQSPFRAGARVETYQLEPVSRAVEAPRVNLLLADDVGLGKTIEAGLVASELLLRHRTRRVLIICPAGLTLKWRDEMADKFGLDFTIIDSTSVARLRRTHGSAANPFRVFPLAIVSLPWLRQPKGQRLLDEVLQQDDPDSTKRPFGLLILDEAHHVAPAVPKQVYAVDSQQTKLLRRLAPFFEHRLFLSATPHNGYQQSFTALLELIDDQKFIRGAEPDASALREVVVRRLKRQITNDDGTPRFQERVVKPIPVEYPEAERKLHAQLVEHAELRARRVSGSARGTKAADLVTLLLKKRFFSSPEAFASTVGVYLETLKAHRGHAHTSPARRSAVEIPEWLESFVGDFAELDDEQLVETEDDRLRQAQTLLTEDADPAHDAAAAVEAEIALLERMLASAQSYAHRKDAKAAELINYLQSVCRPDGQNWTNERVVVFTEYRDTQLWLEGLLKNDGLGEPGRLELLHGGMSAEEREEIRLAFQAHPSTREGKVRILLATDAASEGIDLQDHCHRLVNYDIPFNPNKLEQRIGRIDRYGQRHQPDIRHFVGAGRRSAYDDDLEFLTRVAVKVAQMQEDLGPVNAVLAAAIQRGLTGSLRVTEFDVDTAVQQVLHRPRSGGSVRAAGGEEVGRQLQGRRDDLEQTVERLGLTPANVKRVVDTALELANQRPLTEFVDETCDPGELFDVPPLTGSFARAAEGLIDPLTGEQRHIAFDRDVAAQRSRDYKDTALAHLSHPLVAMSVRLLRAAVWNDAAVGLNRVTAIVSDDPELETTLIGGYARFLIVGADGVRLHEEVMWSGGWLRDGSRFARLENLGAVGGILDRALSGGRLAAPHIQKRVAEAWANQRIQDGLTLALRRRAEDRQKSLEGALERREAAERERVNASLDRFEATLRGALTEEDEEDSLFSLDELKDSHERAQARADRKAWNERLKQLTETRARELAAVSGRYADPTPHMFPVAVVCVIPVKEAMR